MQDSFPKHESNYLPIIFPFQSAKSRGRNLTMVKKTTSRNFLPALVLILLATLARSAYAENKAFDAAALADDIHAEFADFTSAHYDSEADAVGRRLQSNNNNNNGGSSSTETTTCNLWCQIKNSLGLTIVGLVLLCIR